MMLFYLVAYLFGNMGAFFVVQAVARSEGSDDDRRLQRPRAPLAGAGAGVAHLPAVARRHSVRRRLLGEALHLLGRRSSAACTGLAFLGAVADRRRALLLPGRGAPDVHRSARSDAAASAVPALLGLAIVICLLGVVGMGACPAPGSTPRSAPPPACSPLGPLQLVVRWSRCRAMVRIVRWCAEVRPKVRTCERARSNSSSAV